jgi:hypothetical protein
MASPDSCRVRPLPQLVDPHNRSGKPGYRYHDAPSSRHPGPFNFRPNGRARPGKTAVRTAVPRWFADTEEVTRGGPRQMRPRSPARHPETHVSAIPTTPPPQRVRQASKTRVRNQRRTTSPATGFCDAPAHGDICSAMPASPPPTSSRSFRSTPWSVPAAIGCSPRPPAAPAATGSPSSNSWTSSAPATPWSSGNSTASAGSLRHLVDTVTGLADRGVGSAASRRQSTPPPPAASWCSMSSPPWPSSNAVAAIATTLGVSRASIYRHLTRTDRRVG